jgi:hypothetical protein
VRGLRLPLPSFSNGVLMIKWKRPTGSIIETNETDETIKHAIASGWKRVKPVKDKPVKPVKETVEEAVEETDLME